MTSALSRIWRTPTEGRGGAGPDRRSKEGLVELRASLELWDPIVAKDPGNVEAMEVLANVHGDFGDAHRALHDKASAAREYRAAVAMQQRVVAASHGDPERAKTLTDLTSRLAKLH